MEEDVIYEFTEGPYDMMTFRFKEKDGKIVIDIDDGDLGRMPLENLRTVKELQEGLERAEKFFEEKKRRQEEY